MGKIGWRKCTGISMVLKPRHLIESDVNITRLKITLSGEGTPLWV